MINKEFCAQKIGEYLYNCDLKSIIGYIHKRRWFKRKSETIIDLKIKDYAVLNNDPIELLTILEIFYEKFNAEIYYLPLMINIDNKKLVEYETILNIKIDDNKISLYDAFNNIKFCADLLKLIKLEKEIKSLKGIFKFHPTEVLEEYDTNLIETKIKLICTEQSNTSINYNNNLIMKNYRNIQYGVNPDFEITYFLTKQTDLKNIPALLGYVEYQTLDKKVATAAVLQEFITNEGDCWNFTIIQIEQIYRIALRNVRFKAKSDISAIIKEFAHDYLSEIYKLGEVTGLFHKALTTDLDDNAFKAEIVSDGDVDNWQSSMIDHARCVLNKIEENLPFYSEEVQSKVVEILKNKEVYINSINKISLLKRFKQKKIRIHGDYHLGQVLKTENDFVILDFEGEPIRTLEERRAKFLPQKDIAGMLRSINYATYTCLFELPGLDEEALKTLKIWASIWEDQVCNTFLNAYIKTMQDNIPDIQVFKETLEAFKIDKAIYELNYEINNRPEWLKVPVEFLQFIINQT